MARVPCRTPGPEECCRDASPQLLRLPHNQSVYLQNAFHAAWAKAASNNCAFLQLAQSPPWASGTARVESAWPKNRPAFGGGEEKGSVCLQLSLGSLHGTGFVKMSACWDDFVSSDSGRGAHGKVRQEIKAVKVVFLTQQLHVYVSLCTVSLSSLDMAFPSLEGPSLPTGDSGASLNSAERQHVCCILLPTVSPFHCSPRGSVSSARALWQPWCWAGGAYRGPTGSVPGKGLRCPGGLHSKRAAPGSLKRCGRSAVPGGFLQGECT